MTQVFQPPLTPKEAGVALSPRQGLNFVTGAGVTDDPVANETDVSIGGSGSVTSTEASAISQEASVQRASIWSAVSVIQSAVSARSAGAVSTRGMQSILNALSNRISVGAGGSASPTSQAFSVVSQQVSVLSQAVSVISQQVSVLSQGLSALSQATSVADAALSVRVDTQSQGISILSQQASVISQAVSVISQQVSVLSQAHSALSQTVSVISNQVSVHSVRIYSSQTTGAISVSGLISTDNRISNAASVISQAVSIVSTAASNALSVANAASNAASIVSNAVSATSQTASVNDASIWSAVSVLRSAISVRNTAAASVRGLQSGLDAFSNRISAGGATGSVTSTEASAISQEASVQRASIWSAVSVLRSAISVRSTGNVSTRGMQSAMDAISNRVSVAAGGSASPTSQAYSVLSARVASVSVRQFSGSGSTATSSKGLQTAMNTISNTLSQAFSVGSVLSARITSGVGLSAQLRRRIPTALSVVSGTALVDIASMSVSCEATGIYKIEGGLLWEKATSGGVAFGASLPALGAGSYVNMWVNASTAQAGVMGASAKAWGAVALSAVAAGQTAIVSVSVAAINVLRNMHFNAFLAVSAAGSFQLMARGSVAGDSLSVRGGYIQAFRIG